MLPPDRRELLLDALRPPQGYAFDRGIGTTFSLDLLTLLVAPLSLVMMDVTDADQVLQDPVLLLEGLQRYAHRLSIFCQAGRIAIPGTSTHLYRYLEDSVVQVRAPRQKGVFHPKVWLLRYLTDDRPPLFRLLCLTRNLTFDRSWDLVLRLEGELAQGRKVAYSRNHPLGDFVQALPDMAVHAVDQRIQSDVDLLQDEVRRVPFQVPEPFAGDPAFIPSGIRGHRSYKFSRPYRRLLVVSPFLSDRFLSVRAQYGQDHILLSRVDSLGDVRAEVLSQFKTVYVLDEGAKQLLDEEPTEDPEVEVTGMLPEPSGLHAKLFIMEHGWDATWLVGSANATEAAFDNRNVEFMVALGGRRSNVGIDRVLGSESDEFSLRSLLRTYRPPTTDIPDNRDQRRAEECADAVRTWLVDLRLQAEVIEQDDGRYGMELRPAGGSPADPGGDYDITAWPISLHPERARLFEMPLVFSNLSLIGLTPFMAFEVTARYRLASHVVRFVLRVPIFGMPEIRDDHLLTAILADSGQFLRYLRLILMEQGEADGTIGAWSFIAVDGRGSQGSGDRLGVPLLEDLVRALSRSPEKLDRIANLVQRLQRTPQGRELFPQGFEPLWNSIWAARRGQP